MGAGVGVATEQSEMRPATRRRWFRLLVSFLLVVAVALGALWLLRKPLATRYADRFLASKGVPARYGIADLSFGRQRLTNVVLGDPADPDLVADWLEARTAVGLGGATLTGVRGGHVRLRGRLVEGKLTFGSIDRLLPKSDGAKPFALPALDLDVADLRVRLETPQGVAGLKIAGSGRLDRGFTGTVAATAPRLTASGCAMDGVATVMRVRSASAGLLRRTPTMLATGPIRSRLVNCAGVSVANAQLTLDGRVALGEALTWSARTALRTGPVRHARASAAATRATVDLGGDDRSGSGTLDLVADTVAAAPARVRSLAVRGALAFDGAGVSVGEGRPASIVATDARLSPTLLARAEDLTQAGGGTPVQPLLAALARAGRAAGARFDAEATGALIVNRGGGESSVRALAVRARSGARADWAGLAAYGWGKDAGLALDGVMRTGGGGLPTVRAQLAQKEPGVFRGVVTAESYAAGDARLAVTPVTVSVDHGRLRAITTATLSGPFGDGRIDRVSLPLDLVASAAGVTVRGGCRQLGWERIAVSSLVLDRGGVRLCSTGAALVSVANGRVEGGASLGVTRLSGRLGGTPLALAASGARLQLGERGFALQGVQARLGQPGRLTRLDIATLAGRLGAGGLAGHFAGTSGQIGVVPLLLSDAAGAWRVERGVLSLTGGLSVSDAQTDRPRFRPVPVREAALTLAGGTVSARGVVVAPGTSGRKVADVRLVHALKQGAGAATFTVSGLLFDKALQPEQLTPVTFGVVADVRGTVTGEGRIGWNDAGVTSTGVFRTTGTDLAAAFGPVEGIAGEIRFTDLLALQSAPGQRLTVRSVNPGIPVTDGVVRLQTLPNARVQVEGARWPFAGGTLTLEPTLLDFAAAAQRRMTFRVDGMAADQFLQQFDFKNLNATGTFDGVLPMVFDQSGGRIENGRLVVRTGGGQISYVGPIGQKNLGVWANIAFQALKSIRYRNLTIGMDGPLAGEMVTAVRFAGISQGEGAKSNFLIRRLQRLPFVFNIRITAPFRGLLDATASFYDPKRLVQRNLPRLLDEQDKRSQPPQGGPRKTQPPAVRPPTIQPPASEKLP